MDRTLLLALTCILLAACQGREVEKTFHANGKVKHHLQKKNGKLHGTIEEYYASGKIKYRGQWFEGVSNGVIEQYFENGRLRSRAFYTRGKQEGRDEAYFENGKTSFSATYKNGKMTGVSSVYYENGVISERTTYDTLGNVIHHALFSSQGKHLHSYMVPQVEVLKDTLWAGEQAVIAIRFPLPAKGNIVINGTEKGPDQIEEAFTIDKITRHTATADTVLFIRRYYTPGSYLITLRFNHTHTVPRDTLVVQGVKKSYPLFVRGRSVPL
jgi:hypothetical protein